jgi:carboxypeptidase Taq
MHTTKKSFKKLLTYYQELSLLGQIQANLEWDLNVNLPKSAAQTRADQTAYITKLAAEKWQNPELVEMVNAASNEKNLTDEEKAIIRNLEHSLKYYTRIPKDLIVEFSKETSLAFMAWNRAKQTNTFSEFAPHLKSIVKLCQLMADHLTYTDDPYDALLDLYEPGLTTNTCQTLFTEIQAPLTTLLKKIVGSKGYNPQASFVNGETTYPQHKQEELSHFVLKKMGYDFDSGRLDISPHPFTIGMGHNDIRITTMYKPRDFRDSLMASIHEGGHALYEQGVNPEYANTPLDGGVSLGIHESQSRFWENQIGRSREFIQFITPLLQAFYPNLASASHETIAKVFNHVAPGFIRIEADEVTYNLHILLRFELEHALIAGKLAVDDLPEAWNAKMEKYLGIKPQTDTAGVLQDVHWSYGSFGYFPTYTLGNLYAGQLHATLEKQTGYTKNLAAGDLGTPLGWLRANIHTHGSVYTPDQLIKKATGKTLSSQYYLEYITQKYNTIYDL